MAQVNVNQAQEDRLTDLEYVGPVLAERIVNYRQDNNGFTELDDLKDVKGIGDKLYSDIKEANHLNLSPTAETADEMSETSKEKTEKTKEAKVELNIPPADRVEDVNKTWDDKNEATTVQEKSREEHCPALRSCPVYKEYYCEGNNEECARYKIISSSLSSSHIPEILLPTEKERAEAILENNM